VRVLFDVLGIVGVLAAVLVLLGVFVGLPVFSLIMAIRSGDSAQAGCRVRALGKHYDPYTHTWRLNDRRGTATSAPTSQERSRAGQRDES
jgi:hypothetical protein